MNGPTPEQVKEIQKVHNEDPKTRDRALEIIKEWLKQQPHLPSSWEEQDISLLTFLRATYFSLEACKKKLDMYFTVRTAIPEFFSNRDMRRPELQKIFEAGEGIILPDLTPKGQRILMVRGAQPDFETPNFANMFKIIYMVGDIRIFEDPDCLEDIYIIDINFSLLKHFLKVPPMLLKKMFICAQEAYPVLFGAVHIINAPPYIEFIINSLKPFLNEKLRNVIHVHSKVDTLYEFVPKDILPEDYGGKSKTFAEHKKDLIKMLEDHTEWFEKIENLKSDESKRPAKRYHDDLFGFEGSFRELNID